MRSILAICVVASALLLVVVMPAEGGPILTSGWLSRHAIRIVHVEPDYVERMFLVAPQPRAWRRAKPFLLGRDGSLTALSGNPTARRRLGADCKSKPRAPLAPPKTKKGVDLDGVAVVLSRRGTPQVSFRTLREEPDSTTVPGCFRPPRGTSEPTARVWHLGAGGHGATVYIVDVEQDARRRCRGSGGERVGVRRVLGFLTKDGKCRTLQTVDWSGDPDGSDPEVLCGRRNLSPSRPAGVITLGTGAKVERWLMLQAKDGGSEDFNGGSLAVSIWPRLGRRAQKSYDDAVIGKYDFDCD